MKAIKFSFIIAVAVLAIAGISTTSYAFHDGGVARCEGCHTMHNSFQSTTMQVNLAYGPGTNNKFLLQGADQSSTCLNCHGKGSTQSGYHVSTAGINGGIGASGAIPMQETPGGDFSWVKINYKTAAITGTGTGERHGHNIVAVDYGYVADATNTKAPGATTEYLASNLNCISCHDPHANSRRDDSGAIVTRNTAGTFPSIMGSGSYGATATTGEAVGVYRFLGGVGYKPMSYSAAPAFANVPPTAVAPSTYNRSEAVNETHVAYGSGMSQWCANCHDQFLNTSSTLGVSGHPHPAGAVITNTGIINTYNAYVKTGDMSGTQKYTSLVPVESGETDIPTLATQATNTTGAGTYTQAATGAVVMCLSCHRAHASGFDSMIRWYNSDAFITEDGAYFTSGNGNAPTTTAQAQKAYYDRPATNFSAFQRVLCNKCHAKD